MKKYYLFIALAMVAAMTVSCKNKNVKNTASEDADEEVVEAAKTILADDVLAKIDEMAKPYFDSFGKSNFSDIISSHLTEEEKLVKPDYLLDPSEVNNLVTKTQKINALAILIADRTVMKAYEMPVEETTEAIGRLMAEVGAPISVEDPEKKTTSEKISSQYEKCKESGDLPLFWQFHYAMANEFSYIISQNPDLFFRNISDEQRNFLRNQFRTCKEVVKTLAEYDPEVKMAWDTYSKFSANYPDENARHEAYKSAEAAKETFISRKESIAARRAEMLK